MYCLLELDPPTETVMSLGHFVRGLGVGVGTVAAGSGFGRENASSCLVIGCRVPFQLESNRRQEIISKPMVSFSLLWDCVLN